MATSCSLTLEITVDPLVERLVRLATVSLDRAGLDDPLEDLVRMVDSGRLMEVERGRPMVVRLRPFAELALRDAVDISTARGLALAHKRRVFNGA